MTLNASRLEIIPLDESHVKSVIQIAEILEEAPHWSLDSYAELVNKAPSARRIALVARCQPPAQPLAFQEAAEVAGFVIARPVPPEAELESIGVAAHWQRRGIGRRLIEALTSELKKTGVETLHLEVRASNGTAMAFYRSLGWIETGRRPRYYADPQEDAVLMELRLH
jgi:[ribosomal protein S18]-alanine N-acetyltransferase